MLYCFATQTYQASYQERRPPQYTALGISFGADPCRRPL